MHQRKGFQLMLPIDPNFSFALPLIARSPRSEGFLLMYYKVEKPNELRTVHEGSLKLVKTLLLCPSIRTCITTISSDYWLTPKVA